MLTEKDYFFTIVVHPDGNQMPYINYSLKEDDFLKTLIYFQNLRKSEGVINALLIIDKVLSGESDEEEIYDRDIPIDVLCYALVKKEVSTIVDCTAGDRDYILNTVELKKLLENWLDFLFKYENNKIPNLTYGLK